MTDRPVFGRINQNSADKVHKPTIQKSKIIKKNDFLKKLMLKVHHDEFWLRNVPQHLKFLFFMVRTHPTKNSTLELTLESSSNEFLGLFRCLLHHKRIYNDTQIKNTFFQSTLILLENCHTISPLKNPPFFSKIRVF